MFSCDGTGPSLVPVSTDTWEGQTICSHSTVLRKSVRLLGQRAPGERTLTRCGRCHVPRPARGRPTKAREGPRGAPPASSFRFHIPISAAGDYLIQYDILQTVLVLIRHEETIATEPEQ